MTPHNSAFSDGRAVQACSFGRARLLESGFAPKAESMACVSEYFSPDQMMVPASFVKLQQVPLLEP